MSFSFFNIDQNNFESIFPFFIEMDDSLRITNAGISIKKILPHIEGKIITDVFNFNLPILLDVNFETISKHTHQVFILESFEGEILFRKQALAFEKERKLFFIGTPWLLDNKFLEKNGLKNTDFALHDTTVYMLQTEKNNDTETIKKEQLSLIQLSISKVLANTDIFETAISDVIKIICDLFDWKCGVFWMSSDVEYLKMKEESNQSLDGETNLKCFSFWQNEDISKTTFEKWILNKTFLIAEGLKGSVLKENRSYSGKNYFSEYESSDFKDLEKNENFSFHSMFPVVNYGKELGILEFFSDNIDKKDMELVNNLIVINDQLDQYILKKQSDWILKENERRYRLKLEQKVEERTFQLNEEKIYAEQQREIAETNRKLAEEQKEIIIESQREILDSIQYASFIQRAMLTSEEYITKNLKHDYFIFYKPKDIVSGDFYWAVEHNNAFYFSTSDCTGHGVPGAFMSLLNISFLNENVIERNVLEPADILNEQREAIIKALNPTGTENSQDGMDCVLTKFDFEKNLLTFSGANNNLYIVRDKKITEYKGDKMPVGLYGGETRPFKQKEIEMKKGDLVYSFTDGLPDQFGGPIGKKFKRSHLIELLKDNCHLSLTEQKEILSEALKEWMKGYEQIDDILVIGLRI